MCMCRADFVDPVRDHLALTLDGYFSFQSNWDCGALLSQQPRRLLGALDPSLQRKRKKLHVTVLLFFPSSSRCRTVARKLCRFPQLTTGAPLSRMQSCQSADVFGFRLVFGLQVFFGVFSSFHALLQQSDRKLQSDILKSERYPQRKLAEN